MNVMLDLSPGQLSKLRNGHSVRISPTMVGKGMDLIIDPMTYNNLAKKLDKGKGAIIKMGSAEIEQNKMEGTGLFGGGNKSGKISRFKKANRWRDFSRDTVNMGMDLGQRGLDMYNKQKERQSPLGQVKRLFGGEMEVEGGNILKGIKKTYNKKVKNTELGKALRDTASNLITDGYDAGSKVAGSNKYSKPIGEYMAKHRQNNIKKLTGYTGLGLRVGGDGLTMGGRCCGCGMMNDKFLFSDVAL